MTDVIKKGLLEVKKKGRFGGYKQKYVLLTNSLTLKCKSVEILDTADGSKSGVEVIRLTDVWTVQDKPSRSRYAFELIVGEDPIMTFSCATVVEREEWTEAFRVLNQLALPNMETQNSSSPITEYFSVTLMKNRSALEIGHSGQYLLSIKSTAIVLHWRTGAIAHHWPTKNITKLYHPGREGHLLLIVKRVSGSGPPMDFEFVTDKENAVQILKVWNIRLLESIPGDPQQLNEISSSLTTAVTVGKSKRSSRKAKSFRNKDAQKVEPEEAMKRSGSFPRVAAYSTSATIGGMGLSQGSFSSQPLPRTHRDSQSKSWTDYGDQDSYFNPVRPTPPPLPPRPVESSSDEDDPDYAYIDESEVKGPNGQTTVKRTPSSELDDQLKELKKSIQRENKAKRREAERRRAMTLQPRHRTNRPQLSPQFAPAEPQDYLIPVPSKRSQTQSVSSDGRGGSVTDSYRQRFDEDNNSPNTQELSPSSSESSPVFVGNPPTLPPRTWRDGSVVSNDSSAPSPGSAHSGRKQERSEVTRTYGVNENTDSSKTKDSYYTQHDTDKTPGTSAPPLPPRSPTKEFLSRKSSSSSSHSTSSNGHRCPKCHALRKSKSSVSKTVSLESRTSQQSKEESRKSLPNLESTLMRYRHQHQHSCCSEHSSNDQLSSHPKNLEYLQLVDDKVNGESALGPELDLLTSCLQTLEHRVNSKMERDDPPPPLANSEPKKKTRNPYDHIQLKSSESSDSRKSLETDLDLALRQTHQVHSELSHPRTMTLGREHSSPVFSLGSPPSSRRNGLTAPTQRSHSSMASAPPVPPRSNVSLSQQPRGHRDLARLHNGVTHNSKSLGRQASLQKFGHAHPLPPRSSSVLEHTSSFHGNVRNGRDYGVASQGDSQNSSTVFIHHIKDRRLAHMV